MEKAVYKEDFGFLTIHLDGTVLQVRFKDNLLEHLANLSKRDLVFKLVNRISNAGDIKAILIASDFKDTGCDAYHRFFIKKSQEKDRLTLHRLYNITTQFVMGILDLDCMVIHACQGSVISLFLNISLACDYRIASDTTLFCNPYLDMGLIPLGGGPYFLSKMVGTGNAWETLLLNHDISASRARELGLVDCILPSRAFEKQAMEIARKFADHPYGTIKGLKTLVNFSKKEIRPYFDTEKKELFKLINSSCFTKGLAHLSCSNTMASNPELKHPDKKGDNRIKNLSKDSRINRCGSLSDPALANDPEMKNLLKIKRSLY